ncbi:hypothetical protein QBC32DRAFT_352371 [Pseudoneurospora amorphoporcata]|uniref:Uncharacterized protein n=1 Tax=Pseudoneurospora amorphoporcata TaxID=241081 RepID=A0AAN6NQS5_9PEZI|nr:hypothetical protein QBC32DRAFT_352371 [Pseudoneurospora amorphoporcata]
MCIRVLTIFKCACPHRNTLVCPHHIHVREPSTTSSSSTEAASSDRDRSLSSSSSSSCASRPNTSSSSSCSDSPESNTTTTNDTDSDFQKGFQPRLPSALQGHKSWTPLPGKENQRWEHCPGYLAKSRALALATAGANGKAGGGGGEGMIGKEMQCAEYKATEPKFRRRWEVKSGLCGECRGVHGMDGPGPGVGPGVGVGDVKVEGEKEKEKVRVNGVMGKGSEAERGRARSRAATDPTLGAVPVPVDAGGDVVKGVSGKVVGRRVVRKRIPTL